MDDKEALAIMQRCLSEVKETRARIDYLAPRAEAFIVISKIMDLVPGRSVGMSEDIVWILNREITKLTEKLKGSPDA